MATRPRRRRSKFAHATGRPVRKHSLYFPAYILAEIGAEAVRLDRSLSWLVQHAWKRARAEIAGDRSGEREADERARSRVTGRYSSPA
jgi:uncharacterized small protein (TIGR04563 family)